MDNSYSQKSSGRKKGCQIDYLVQTRSHTLFVCEVKMRRCELGLEVINAMKIKIAALSLAKGFGTCSVSSTCHLECFFEQQLFLSYYRYI